MKTENIEDIYELTPLQKGILFHSLYNPELGLYFIQISYTLGGNLNIVAFERAWQTVIYRHTALRTGFYWEEIDKPLQVVYKQVKVPLEQYDWREMDTVEQQEALRSFLLSDRKQGFDLAQECLMRLHLIRLTDNSYEFIWSKHHLIMDGWSMPIVLKDFVQTYEILCREQEVCLAPSRPFRDYIGWLQQQDQDQAEEFWRQAMREIKEPTPLTNLSADNLSQQAERYDEEQIKLSAATTEALQSLVSQHHLTLNTLVQGAWAILLGHYSCRNNVVYGCTVSGRPVDLAGADAMVGVFINTLPIHVKLDGEQLILPWLQQLQAQLVDARQYEYSPLTDIQGWSQVQRGLPLFESILVFENQPVTQFLRNWQGNIEIQSTNLFYKTNYPLTVVVYPGSELAIAISYDFRRFDVITIAEILKDFEILLLNIVTNPHIRLQDLQFLREREQMLATMLEKEATFNFDYLLSVPAQVQA
ncbi:non-ribosomal peptide synthase [Cylindrospermum stagnale PCC 7417]|uniref:Non-ribosomal peptide synthase n=1 Tax=Cylindrospermum stagnale PCC 7417 TaxID=56107 RepID=K9WVJ6_9NOST|nr:condensation domain-containing protein [Cylindrospermum stagnale]AFZ23811.1 non-ribosomal peptide synthase [Cylindrospermum stagnale PCC 7417]